jgi:hypothetical protein
LFRAGWFVRKRRLELALFQEGIKNILSEMLPVLQAEKRLHLLSASRFVTKFQQPLSVCGNMCGR